MNILEHLYQSVIYRITVFGIDISITNGVITMWTATILTIVFYFYVSRNLKLIPAKIQNVAEIIILFIRDEVASEIKENNDKWLYFLIALFSFILMNNLVALMPGFQGSTTNLNTTGTLAGIVFVVVQAAGIYKHGLIGYLRSLLPEEVPWPILIFMAPVEIVSQLAKPFSLAMRLFANMFAGHAIMIIFLSLIIIFKNYFIAPFPLIGNVMFSILEILLSIIQAFVFTYLTSLYIATAQEGH